MPQIIGWTLTSTIFWLFWLTAPVLAQRETFFQTNAKQERCALLSKWTDPLAPQVYASTLGPGIWSVAPYFRDTVFKPIFGKGYWELSPDERKEIAKSLKGCFKDWRSTQLLKPFAEEPPPSDWAFAINRAQPNPSGRNTRGQPAKPIRGPENTIDWPTLGLRVAVREVSFPNRGALVPYIVAVQENSPAYFAGVRPGDVVSFLKCWEVDYNFIVQQRRGVAYFPSYTNATPVAAEDSTVFRVAARVPQGCPVDKQALLSIAIPTGDTRQQQEFISMLTVAEAGGRWLTDPKSIADNRTSALAAMKTRYQELLRRTPEELQKSPCSYDLSNSHDFKALPPILRELANAKTAAGMGEENLFYWRDVRQVYCDEERYGRLPSFETAIYLMSRGKLDPCAYDPKVDYSAIPENHEKMERRHSRSEYDTMLNLGYILNRNTTETQRTCFFNLVRAQLTNGARTR